MRLVFAVLTLLSFAGIAAAEPRDKSDAPKQPEQGAVLRNPLTPAAPKGMPHPMMGRPDAAPVPGLQTGQPGIQAGPHPGQGPQAGGVPRGAHDGGVGGPGRGSHDGGVGRLPRGNGSHGGWDRHHHGRGGVVVFPYPPLPGGTWWPYPPYPYPPDGYYDGGDDDMNAPPDGPGGPQGGPPDGSYEAEAPAFWYYCDQPDGYYPYVKSCSHDWSTIPISPPPPGAGVPLSYSDWQWCEEAKSFFPYVASCRGGFVAIPVTAPASDSAPAVANWFFCEDPRGYLPYVVQCKKDWRAVPAVPPPSVPVTVKPAAAAKPKKK
jgi:hypothetical protein